jgi:hypothetical protein
LEESPRKIKDLNPENRKKRIEPPKPWGKFERLVVLFTLLFTIVAALLLILYSKGYRLPEVDFNSFNFFEEKVVVIK